MRVIIRPDARLGTATSAHGNRRILWRCKKSQLPRYPPRNPPYATSPPRRSAKKSAASLNSSGLVTT